jgi:hypothetical protein
MLTLGSRSRGTSPNAPSTEPKAQTEFLLPSIPSKRGSESSMDDKARGDMVAYLFEINDCDILFVEEQRGRDGTRKVVGAAKLTVI